MATESDKYIREQLDDLKDGMRRLEQALLGDGTPGKGLANRVDRIEVVQARHSWLIRSIVATVISGVGGLVFAFVRHFKPLCELTN